MKELNQYELENVAGGVIPALIGAYAALAATGFGSGITVGLASLKD
ncbi:class IIb bacteriocin, lactobin A/cerein 7B family [Neisseria canis]|uniref:Class IIb bacteriocin, lactobin A/cerein 7B family n=1 Tax=Neisseria canis TaxID=493 RepID=A0A448D516_9NEIS|nr:class IIb bacteriocin, lactobin A/cerein 7B family [Neisseria canis]VEE98991.1 class IIb bacteriocin, lactobin A/cerein 7B family [Neisseria canis]